MSVARSDTRLLRLGSVVAWVALVLFETVAQAALKAGGEALAGLPFGRAFLLAALGEPWVYCGAVGYLGAFAAWMFILDRTSLSRGFPLTSIVALSIVGASVFVFGETLDATRTAGVAMILGGLLVMGNEDA